MNLTASKTLVCFFAAALLVLVCLIDDLVDDLVDDLINDLGSNLDKQK